MIPGGRRLYALGHMVYLLSSLVSTAEGFQREELYQNAKGHGRTLSSYAAQLCELLLQHGIYMYSMLAMWVVFLSCLVHYTKNFQTLWVNKLLLTLKCLCCLALQLKTLLKILFVWAQCSSCVLLTAYLLTTIWKNPVLCWRG